MKVIHRIERKIKTQKKKVAAYARVSIETEKTLQSLSMQVSYFSKLIQSNPEWEYVGVYVDEGISGRSTEKRKEFKRMIKDCERGKIDIILTKSIQRFSRNTVDLLSTIRHLKDLGVEVRFEKERINTLTSEGEFMITILTSFAQEEAKSISENIKWRVKKKYESGYANNRFSIYGYKWVENQMVVVPKEEVVIKKIYKLFLEGKAKTKIAKILNEEGYRTRKTKWNESSVKNILTNITYTGNLLLQKTYTAGLKRKYNKGEIPQYWVEGTHQPIIDIDTFNLVQNEIKRRRSITLNVRYKKNNEKFIRNNGYWKYKDISIKDSYLCSSLGLEKIDRELFITKIFCIYIIDENTFEIVGGGIFEESYNNTCDNKI